MKQKLDLGQFEDGAQTFDVWLEVGPSESKTSSRQPDGTWLTDRRKFDLGPVLCWQSTGRVRGCITKIHLRQVLDISISSKPLHLPAQDDGPPEAGIPGPDKARLATAALTMLSAAMLGSFSIEWQPNDPNVPF